LFTRTCICQVCGGGVALGLPKDRAANSNRIAKPPIFPEKPVIVFRARILVNSGQRAEVVRSLRRIFGETRVLDGCISCQLYADVEDENQLLLVEQWTNMSRLRAHLRSESFLVVLSALDYAVEAPEICFDTISKTDGLDLIKTCRET
jgi:quinol monooxygenase YgiN